jgi:hypothetical protein
MARFALVVAVLAACSKSNPNCEPAVKHVMRLAEGPPGVPRPKGEEKFVIEQITKQVLQVCNDEGLTEAQRDCILAAKSLTERSFLTCPALVAKPPSWIMAPIGHPDYEEELKKLEPPPVDETKLDDGKP